MSIEIVLNDIETFLKANLNTSISTEIAKHTEPLALEFQSEDYHIQFFDLNCVNSSEFISIQAKLTGNENSGPISKETYNISVVLFVEFDRNQNNSEIYKTVFRAQRALNRLLVENYNKISKKTDFNVKSGSPEELLEDNKHLAIFGAFLECSLVGG